MAPDFVSFSSLLLLPLSPGPFWEWVVRWEAWTLLLCTGGSIPVKDKTLHHSEKASADANAKLHYSQIEETSGDCR